MFIVKSIVLFISLSLTLGLPFPRSMSHDEEVRKIKRLQEENKQLRQQVRKSEDFNVIKFKFAVP